MGRFVTALLAIAVVNVAAGVREVGYGAALPRELAITGIDHIPVAVRDLETAARRFQELGFALKPGRPHANGIRNQHMKFPDGTEIELITAPEARDSLTTKYRRHLESGDGPAFVAFFAPAFDLLSARLDEAKVSHRRNPGLIDITDDHMLDYIFFGRRNQSPTDRPEHFAHANGAESLIGVWLAGNDLSQERSMFEALGLTFTREAVRVPDAVTADIARFGESEIVLLPGSRQLIPGRRIVGATLRVGSVSRAREVIGAAAVEGDSSVFLPPSSTHGLWVEFRKGR